MKEAHDALQLASSYIDELSKTGERMALWHLSQHEIDKLVNELFQIADDASPLIKKRNVERRATCHQAVHADDLWNFRGTKWQVINAAADMADHAQPLRMTKTSKEIRLKDVFAGHPLLYKAYELVMAK